MTRKSGSMNWMRYRYWNICIETFCLRQPLNKIEISTVIPCRAHPRKRIHRKILTELEQTFPGKVAPYIRECSPCRVTRERAAGNSDKVLSQIKLKNLCKAGCGGRSFRVLVMPLGGRVSSQIRTRTH